jgi:hypothetical protein
MMLAFKLGGVLAAHAISWFSDRTVLRPMLAYATAVGKRTMTVLVVDNDLPASVALGRQKLQSNDMHAADAALVYDGRITLDNEKVDAIILEMRTYCSPKSEAVMAIPYMPKSSGRFRVYKPRLLTWKNCEEFNKEVVMPFFFIGVNEHKTGMKVWKECLDASK